MTTPEGSAATRCEICQREKLDPQSSYVFASIEEFHRRCGSGHSGFAVTETCLRLGYELARARLVEVERENTRLCSDLTDLRSERDAAQKSVQIMAEKLDAAESRALAAEARLSGVEGALRSYVNAHKKRRNATETVPCECFLCEDARAALSGSPPISGAGEAPVWPEYKVSVFNQESYPGADLPPGGIWKLWVDEQGRRCSRAVAEIETKEDAEALAKLLGLKGDSEWTRYGERLADQLSAAPISDPDSSQKGDPK